MDSIFDEDVDEVGGEIEAYCPSSRCKADTTHTIISMYEDEVRRVQCVVCGEIHAYRKPRGEAYDDPVEPAPLRKKLTRKPTWEEAMSQVSEDELANCRPYSIRDTYQELDIVSHPTFGVGFVTELLPDNKVEISFRDEQRILVHNRGDLAEKMPGLSNTPPPREEKRKKRKKRSASSLIRQFQQAAAEAEAEDDEHKDRTASIKQAAEQLRAKQRRREPDIMDEDFGDDLELDEVDIKTELARRAAAEKSGPKGPGRGKKPARPAVPGFAREAEIIAPALFEAEGDVFEDLAPDLEIFGEEPEEEGAIAPATPAPAKRAARAGRRKTEAVGGAEPLAEAEAEVEESLEFEPAEALGAPVRKPTRRAKKPGAAAPAQAAGAEQPAAAAQAAGAAATEGKKAQAAEGRAPARAARGPKAAAKEAAARAPAAKETAAKKAAGKETAGKKPAALAAPDRKAAKGKAAGKKSAAQPAAKKAAAQPAARAADKKAAKAASKKAGKDKAADRKAASKKPAAGKSAARAAASKAKPSARVEKASKAGAKKAAAKKPAAGKGAARKPAAAKAAPPKSAAKPAAGKAAAKARPAAAKAASRKASAAPAAKASSKAAGAAAKRGAARAADKKKGAAARTPATPVKAGKDKAAKRPAARAKKRA